MKVKVSQRYQNKMNKTKLGKLGSKFKMNKIMKVSRKCASKKNKMMRKLIKI